jgi:flavin reductase (DIM6/NTAB) family NADH-FMN oxidoreductase RutF
MAKVVKQDIGAYCYHYPLVAAIVTAQSKGKENAMALAWHAPISLSPPLYGIALAAKRFTYKLITESQEFGVNFVPFDEAELVAAVGGSSGQEVDKFSRFNIAKDKPLKTQVPILSAAYAAYECKVFDEHIYGDHRLVVGEVVAVHSAEEAFTREGTLDISKVSPTLYIGGERYITASGEAIKHLDRKVYGQS